jgi:hypothetical protein
VTATPWWDQPHNIRIRERCTATLTPDPRTRCTQWAHHTTDNGPDTWHRWSIVRWGAATPDLLARGVIGTGHSRYPTITDLTHTLLGDPR